MNNATPRGMTDLHTADRLIFLHLHKTGGSAIHELLVRHLPPGSIAPKDRSGSLEAEAVSLRHSVISAHVTAHFIQSLSGPSRVFTVLREPRERTLSQIYFLKSYAQEHLETYNNPVALRIKQTNLKELLRDEDRMKWARDYYVKRLDPFYDAASSHSIEPDVSRAMDFLRSCTVVGVTARLDCFARAAFPYFGLAADVQLPFVNRRQDLERMPGFEPVTIETLSDDDEALIAELTKNDCALYAYALSVAPRA